MTRSPDIRCSKYSANVSGLSRNLFWLYEKVLEEEYIDLEPILNNLYFDADKVLDSIKKVKVQYD